MIKENKTTDGTMIQKPIDSSMDISHIYTINTPELLHKGQTSPAASSHYPPKPSNNGGHND